ncbi:hypothetical protein HPG69_011546 [Diceros bicornis minor]|uniref:Uncharacterized protein n=1 Tax=Diceros bicornis minor TaxID=77932 RepID=A0A7J7EJ76_DICBM|nr:hypothetical protein HPG69_011546 [Diceros bicornis minor]
MWRQQLSLHGSGSEALNTDRPQAAAGGLIRCCHCSPDQHLPGCPPRESLRNWKQVLAFLALVLQTEVQVNGDGASREPDPATPYALKTPILAKLNFYLKKKFLGIHLGSLIESREQVVAVPKNISAQESFRSPNNQEKTLLQELHIPPVIACAPAWSTLKKSLQLN